MRTRIGKFEIQRRLGEGAMGEVFLGRDPIIGREVAIKTIRPQVATGEEARERFYREARAAGTLNHPNLVTVHEFGEDDGTLFLAMEYVPGQDLQVLLVDHALSRPQILEIVAQICDGLAYAHARGVMHRDIKPSNIRVDWHHGRPFVKVMDFGIARIAGESGQGMTGSGTILGTFGYMAPEYIQSGIPDPRADIFACGVILYEALAGERPFAGDTTATVLYRIVHQEPKPLDPSRLSGISPAVQGILDQALVKDPSRRYQRPEVMAAALRAAKDPEWQGGVSMGTTSSAAQGPAPAPTAGSAGAQPPTAIVTGQDPTVKSASAARVPAAAHSSSPSKPWLWVAGLAMFAGLGAAGGWYAWRARAEGDSKATLQTAQIQLPPPASVPPSPTVAATPVKAEKGVTEAPKQAITPIHEPRELPPPKAAPAPEPSSEEPAEEPTTRQAARAERQGLNEAAGEIESHPVNAHRAFQELQRQDPQNAKAYALDMVALYHMNHYGEMVALLHKAKANGVSPRAFRTYPRFRVMMKEEAAAHRIPQGIAERLKLAGHDPAAEE